LGRISQRSGRAGSPGPLQEYSSTLSGSISVTLLSMTMPLSVKLSFAAPPTDNSIEPGASHLTSSSLSVSAAQTRSRLSSRTRLSLASVTSPLRVNFAFPNSASLMPAAPSLRLRGRKREGFNATCPRPP